MKRAWYFDSISDFLNKDIENVLGQLCENNEFSLEISQRESWTYEIKIMQNVLQNYRNVSGSMFFEFVIPRMGHWADVILVIDRAVFVLEFKVGETVYRKTDIEQVYGYCIDLQNFHESSHDKLIIPVLICTNAENHAIHLQETKHKDQIFKPIKCNVETLPEAIHQGIMYAQSTDNPLIDCQEWFEGRYCPTPTIIEAALALYQGHSVEEITRNDAGAYNLTLTGKAVESIIKQTQEHKEKSICFITGVPGAGKTLAGLNIATKYNDNESNQVRSVFLSGNGPLVQILVEALVRDKVIREKKLGKRITKKQIQSEVKTFVQNVHHFRDDCLTNNNKPPIEHIAIFDEAQRAWNLEQTKTFMFKKKHQPSFNMSESEYLISCLNRHPDWATIVCLVGGGQEITDGEAGISAWLEAIYNSFPDWSVFIAPDFLNDEYNVGNIIDQLQAKHRVHFCPELHLSTSVRSFRSEKVSLFVKQLLDRDKDAAQQTYSQLEKYPIVLTRDIKKAKHWLKEKARGSERYGIIASSRAERLKPYSINVKNLKLDPVHWFLESKDDVRSSFFLEDVATEYEVQGLELDWICVGWDADFRYAPNGWEYKYFSSTKWCNVHKEDKKMYIKNAYRVLLTRARQGMVIFVPTGNEKDATRNPEFYNNTYEYLKQIGIQEI